MRKRIGRLARPVPALLLFWAALTPVLWLGGVAPSSIEAMLRLVLSPLWFLGVFAGLTALTPVLVRLWERLGRLAVGLSAGIVAVVDVVRFAVGGPVWLGWVNLLAGWAVPFLIGIAWSKGRAPSREAAWALLGGGIAATAGLVLFAGYPASMVGVPGAAISNLNPPTLAAVTFGLAQAGLIMLVKDRLGRLMRKPLAWAGTAVLNLSAMTVFLWHQTAMMLVTVGALTFGILPGLHTPPADGTWIGARLLWLVPIAAALAGLRIVFQRYENPKIK